MPDRDAIAMIECSRVLVVEDEALVGMLLEDMLEDIGCKHVHLVPRFEEAMHVAAHDEYDLAVLDVNLDGINSFPIAECLLARGIPFIFATGYGSVGMDPRYANVPILQKPFFFHDLERLVKQVLNASSAT